MEIITRHSSYLFVNAITEMITSSLECGDNDINTHLRRKLSLSTLKLHYSKVDIEKLITEWSDDEVIVLDETIAVAIDTIQLTMKSLRNKKLCNNPKLRDYIDVRFDYSSDIISIKIKLVKL